MNLAPTGWVDPRRRPVGWDWPTGRRRTRLEGLLRNDPLYFRASALPTLDQNFAEDRSLVDRISGRQLISFSRSSTGTYIAQDGLLKTAATNEPRFDHDPATGRCQGLLVEATRTNQQSYSTDFTNFQQASGNTARWADRVEVNVIPFANTDPAGTFNASRIIPTTNSTSHYIGRYFVYVAGAYRFSIYVKPAGYSAISITANFPSATIRLSGDGAILSDGGIGATIQRLSNNWYRVTCSIFYAGGGANTLQPRIAILNDSLQSTFSGDGISGIEVYGFQAETGSFATSYIPTPATFTGRTSTATFYDANGIIQTAASGVARSNAWFPDSNGVMRLAGLLLETAATNLLNGSQTFATSGGTQNNWVDTNITRDGTLRTSPDGTANALRITAAANNATITSSAAVGTSAVRTFSIFLRRVTGTGNIQYTLDNGTTWTTQAITGSWVRYSFPATTAGQQVGIRIVTSGDVIELWGAQLEAGTYATSYIPTTTATVTRAADTATSSTVTRAADVLQMTSAEVSNWYNQSQGTMLFNSGSGDSVNNNATITFGGFVLNTAASELRTSSAQAIITSIPFTAYSPRRYIFGLQSDNYVAAISQGSGTPQLLSATQNASYSPAGTAFAINTPGANESGYFRRITYWPARLPTPVISSIARLAT